MDQETTLILEIAFIMIGAGVAGIIFSRLRVPVIIGYLFAGILLGPHVLPEYSVTDIDIINFLADLGIILLMFSIGLDFNLKRLKEVGMFAVLAGTIEVAITILIGYEVGMMMGWGNLESIFLGSVLAISSTAIIIRILTETGNMNKSFADAIIGLLIMEDIAAIIILTTLSPLAAGQTPGINTMFSELAAIAGFMALSLILGVAVVPKVINWVGKNFDDEVLMLVSLGFCFGISIFALWIGLSVAIGAFILGVVIAESKEGDRITHKICSIKEMFMAIFFVSIGLLIDPVLILNNLWLVAIIAFTFIVGKIFAVATACYVSNLDLRTSVTTGFAMVAMGEFSFVIAKAGLDTGVVDDTFYSCVIGAALVTMVTMPVMFMRTSRFIEWASGHAPRSLRLSVRRLESMRIELGRCLETKADRRRKVMFQSFWIIIDFTILFVIQLFVIFVYDLSALLEPIADWLQVVPDVFATIISVLLIIPPLADILVRVRRIGYIVVQGVLEGGMYHWDSGRLMLKIFVNFVTVVIGIIAFLIILPLAEIYQEVPLLPLAAIVIGIAIAYLVWDTNKATYEKMCTVLTNGLLNPDEKK